MNIEDITIIIKTFERRKSLWRLLKSIQRFFPNNQIIVLDDSKYNYKDNTLKEFPDLLLNYIVSDFDIGLSKGRNIMLKEVKTDFFLLCDDDFEFDERTDLEKAINILKKSNSDILAGKVYNIFTLNSLYSVLWAMKKPSRIKNILNSVELASVYNGYFQLNGNSIELRLNRSTSDFDTEPYYNVDLVNNFFLAKTKSIKMMGGWQPEFVKVGEHQLFFYRAKVCGLTVSFSPKFGVKHFPKKTISYNKYRFRSFLMLKQGLYKLGLNEYKVIDEKEQIVLEFNRKEFEKNGR